MRTDVERWEKKYQRSEAVTSLKPDSLLAKYSNLLKNKGLALDLAAGTCQTSVQLAKLINQVIAVDCSLTALQLGQRLADDHNVRLHPLVADLSDWPIPRSVFDLVTCFRYLDREMFPKMEQALKPGGLLVYKTFNEHYVREAPSFNPNYLLSAGELTKRFSNLEMIICNDGFDSSEIYSFAIARRPKKSDIG